MKEQKTKPETPLPKVLQRSVRTMKGKISLNKSLDNFRKTSHTIRMLQQPKDKQQHASPEQYATEKTIEAGEHVTRQISGKTVDVAKIVAQKTFNKAIHTRRKANRTERTTNKSVKNTRRTVKATSKGVKTAAKTVKRTAQAAKRTAIIAKKAAVAAAKVVKLTVKAIIMAVKATMAAVKGLNALIAAGGWIVVVVIIIIAVIAATVSSPLAMFSNDSDGTTPTISEVVKEINGEYAGTITSIIADSGAVDEVIVEGETESSDYTVGNWIDVLGVFSVKSTVTTGEEEFVPLVYMEDKQISKLKDVFWSMNVISHEIVTETVESDPAPGASASPSASPEPEPTPRTIRKLVISIDCKTYEQGAQIYGFSDEKMEVLEELMQPGYLPMFMEICGMDSYTGLTPEQLQALISDLPEGELGSVIVQYAVSRLGDPYSKAKRGQGSYVDCSYFARWCYQQAGVADFTAPTAASQAQYCVDNNLCVSFSDLLPGDLIFWSFKKNGRYMNISHVGIYAGDGYVIDASSSRGMVVYRPIFSESSIVVCGRPHVLGGT